ncbi:tetratricopeptide repeat protein [Altererythrobacter salegens]|uniref:Tetratricopeptide repeat protein n=1 Tax=Croceibacterium salegens TaxID=1737568 RepID=A0A6I4SZC7_9SPHN|nr:tetratricopeptide repeat protein [Croceibacterium salegens]MXO59622.1 tetratricopeptide repeat protein [Croceibacterium salegens]
MTWVLAIGLALVAFAVIAFAFRLPKATWATVGAALAFGLVGYALQGKPELPGAPKEASVATAGTGETLVELRHVVVPEQFRSTSGRMITADALARRDRPADAATILRGAIRENPKDSEAWLALGNALVEDADGQMTAAARFAYLKSEQLSPESPGVPFFLGIAQANAGQLMDVRALWGEAARRAPEGSEAGKEIDDHIARLETVMRQILKQQGLEPPPAK